MRYSVKIEVYKEGIPFNKWFEYESSKKETAMELMNNFGFKEDEIGVVIVNNYQIEKKRVLKDNDRIKFIGYIYPGYL